jgi:type IV fimbrial biogenesis protein FimT
MNSSTPLQATLSSTRIQPLRHAEQGFTLVELLMALAVMAILVMFAVPSFNSLMDSSKLTAASNALLSSMHLARSEAIKRGGRVVLCKTFDGVVCAERGGWEQGWMVFHDSNNNGERDSNEVVVQRIQPLSASLRLTGNSTVARYVSFISTGGTRQVGGGFQAGTLTVCNQSAREARQIVLNAVGRPRVQRVAVASCA